MLHIPIMIVLLSSASLHSMDFIINKITRGLFSSTHTQNREDLESFRAERKERKREEEKPFMQIESVSPQKFLPTVEWFKETCKNPSINLNSLKEGLGCFEKYISNNPELTNKNDCENALKECYVIIFDKEVALLEDEIKTKLDNATKKELSEFKDKLQELQTDLKLKPQLSTKENALKFLDHLISIEEIAKHAENTIQVAILKGRMNLNNLEKAQTLLIQSALQIEKINKTPLMEEYHEKTRQRNKKLEQLWDAIWHEYAKIIKPIEYYAIGDAGHCLPYKNALIQFEITAPPYCIEQHKQEIEDLKTMLNKRMLHCLDLKERKSYKK